MDDQEFIFVSGLPICSPLSSEVQALTFPNLISEEVGQGDLPWTL